MSADNWEICPKCLDEARAKYHAALDAVHAAYGKIPVEEFDAKRTEIAESAPDPEDFRTFREDYEIFGAASGTIKVDYSGHCSKCYLGTDFKSERQFYDGSEE